MREDGGERRQENGHVGTREQHSGILFNYRCFNCQGICFLLIQERVEFYQGFFLLLGIGMI